MLLAELQVRKLLFLHRPGGLRQGGLLVPIVNLTTDVPALLASREISRKEALILKQARRLCEEASPLPLTVAITSPLNLLRELFTVKGAGTLLRRGARIVRHEGWEGVDVSRVRELLTSSFGRAPVEAFFARRPCCVYLEESYRGCAILTDSPLGAYLTKFAVSAEAQGEGMARDLWEALVADTPVLFWRARRTNPISEWYVKLCDGLVRLPDWTVYWKGLGPGAHPCGDRLGGRPAGGHLAERRLIVEPPGEATRGEPFKWCARRDSNAGPSDPESDALSGLSYGRRKLSKELG